MTWTRLGRIMMKLRIRPGGIGVDRLLIYTALLITTLAAILGLFKGQFGDEDEKIAAAIYAAQGSSLYGGQLLNHGPLPFLFASLGYRIHGVLGSLAALRLLPATLAILSTFLIGKTPLIRSGLLRGYAALSWSVFLSMFWTVKTMQMAIYHGLGGLLATVLVVGVLLPLERGDQRFSRLILGACVIGAYLSLASLTFLPFVLSVLLTILAFRFLTLSARKSKSSRTQASKEDRLYSNVASSFLLLGIFGLVVFALLVVSGVVSLQGIFYGHIYFNQSILSKLASPLNLAFVLYEQKDSMAVNALRVILLAGIFIVPVWFQYLPSRKIRRPYLYALAILPASFGIVFQSYRVGLGSIASFYALPYLLPATALLLVGSLAIYEDYRGQALYVWQRVYRSLLVSVPLAVLIIFGVYRGVDPEFKAAQIYLFSALNHGLVDRSSARRTYEDDMVADLIAKIEYPMHAKKVKLFAWPFYPSFFVVHDRPSAYPVNWFVWHNELVENDKVLSRYHACDPSWSLPDSPDIIYYSKWSLNDKNSRKYGQCLINMMDERYVKLSDTIYLRKDHASLLEGFYATHPQYENLATILTPLNWKEGVELPVSFEPVLLQRNHTTDYRIVAQRDGIFDVLGLTLPVFNATHDGEVYVCVNLLSSDQSACSEKVDLSAILENKMTRFTFREPLAIKSGSILNLSLVSINTPDHASKDNIGLWIVPRLSAPLVFTGRRDRQASESR